ncbi:MAG: extensin family protein [Alphaproteobacteria bacterium]|nr:MAG: extensin family protein [Alphaproteobacteria bacterium]
MNSTAENASRKWAYGAFGRRPAAMVTVTALLLVLCTQIGPAQAARRPLPGIWGDLFGNPPPRLRRKVRAASVPLPRPRPAEAPVAPPEPSAAEKSVPAGADKPAEQAAPAAPPPSACRQALTDEIAIAPSIPDIHGPGGCGGEDLVRLETVVLPDKHRMQVNPPAILRCKMASAIADWIRTDMAPLAAGLGSVLSGLDNFDSYDCRGRNGVAGAMLSEHGRANALDVRALKLADGQSIALTDRTVPRDLRESALHAACARFTTVLGPDSDWYHEDHIHLDLMERRNNYRICQWDVLDPLPQVAPLLPAERPADAPPREVAVKSDSQPKSDGQPKSDAAKPATAKPEAETTQSTQTPATKKRRNNRRF